jgi:hydroxymethylpyrimidine pyrophosphatase-like HAD family hydrolase
MFKYAALATDYDGTIASDGRVDERTVAALARARASGVRLLLITGRELGHLFDVFEHHTVFDFIVAENGAVLFDVAAQVTEDLGTAPPLSLLSLLATESVPVSVGRSIVATSERYERVVRAAIRDLALEWHVILNKGSLMALPANVSKASGLEAALARIAVPPALTVGVGDAENDAAFLKRCGLAVAVANALPSVKAIAQLITSRPSGAGVAELIDSLWTQRSGL